MAPSPPERARETKAEVAGRGSSTSGRSGRNLAAEIGRSRWGSGRELSRRADALLARRWEPKYPGEKSGANLGLEKLKLEKGGERRGKNYI